MLERTQLQPLVERVLEQAGAQASNGHPFEPTILLHAEDGWTVEAVDDRTLRAAEGLDRVIETARVHGADAFVCVRPAADGALAVIAQSRAGDSVCGHATAASGWVVEHLDDPELEHLRGRLAALLELHA